MRALRGALLGCAVGLLFGACAASADPVADFYRGKQISMIIPSGVGGGYDLYARFLARFLGSHIPGAPTVIVRNMPGAGGVVAANYLYTIAAPDGLTIGELQNTITLNQLAKTPSIKFDVRKFAWIGSMSTASTICALSGKAKDLKAKALLDTEVLLGASSGSALIIPALLDHLAGAHFKIVQGYVSTSNVQLAMENGEVNGLCGWSWDGARVNAKSMLERGIAKVGLDTAIQPEPELKKDGVPFLMDLIPDGENKDILKMILSTQVYNRPFASPPNTPADRADALRAAFSATLEDPQFKAEADKVGIDVQYLSAQRIDELMSLVFDAPPALQARAADELEKAGFGGK